MLDRAEPLFLPGYFPDVRPIAATRARVNIARGQLDDARAWARERGLDPADQPAYLAEYSQLTLARLLIAAGSAAAALALLDRVVQAAGEAGRDGSLNEAYLVRALAKRATGEVAAAITDLSAALARAVPAGYRQLFLDEGPVLTDLLAEVARVGTDDVRLHAQVLLGTPSPSEPASATAATPDAVLSERELEVLRLVARGSDNATIAADLHLSVRTVERHLQRIYAKLELSGPSARAGAVANLLGSAPSTR